MKKILLTMIVVIMTTSIIITQTGCTEKPVSKTSYYMDTICQITIYDMDGMGEENAESAIDSAFALCAEYESLISATRSESDIYKLNHAGGKACTCDPRTVSLLKKALHYGELSGGAFDITLGKAAALWDFHDESPKVPSAEAVKEALVGVDYRAVKIDGDVVTLENPGAEITLGGIGKGYVADRAAEHLEDLGVTSAIVNFGGNIIAIGDKDGEPFQIGIEKPFTEQGEIIGSVAATDATVVTSGIYERGFEADGTYYHHILDVKTGWPVENDVVSVTLVGVKGMSADCDAMSTICLTLGIADGLDFIEGIDGVEALFVDQDGVITKTSGFDGFVEK
ncbi:FAD:protein FMN transferase [Ihubacter sp. rT4E-8]|uniref:FAD:protein FMN transferase n=1 Tax=Ihubacter sp. rT4E-8 TaxID=3242369 RepID=UPI003CED573B